MKLPRWLVITGIILAVPAVAFLLWVAEGNRRLDHEIRQAEKHGLFLDVSAFPAARSRVPAWLNAAPIYQKLDTKLDKDLETVSRDLLAADSRENRAAAEKLLAEEAPRLAILEQAQAKPYCDFRRDWSEGYAVLMPEYMPMKDSAHLYVLRATLLFRRGNVAEALAEVRKVKRIATHLGDDATDIASAVQLHMDKVVVRTLGSWLAERPQEASVRAALAGFEISRPISPDRVLAQDFYSTLKLLDQTRTAEGREALGLKADDLPPLEGFLPGVMVSRVRADIVRSFRRMAEALQLPEAQARPAFNEASQEMREALSWFPTASLISESWTSTFDDESAYDALRGKHISTQFLALQRDAILAAITPAGPAETIPLAKLVAAYPGLRLEYKKTARRLEVTVSVEASTQRDPLFIPLRSGS